MQQQMQAQHQSTLNLFAAMYNAHAVMEENSLRPVPTAAGVIPANFPATRGALLHLTNPVAEGLLAAYGISPANAAAGNVDVRRQENCRTLAIHVGLRV